MEDRRKHQRFKLKDSCIINHSEVVGTIVDLSMGGLSCVCLNQNNCKVNQPVEVDIYCRKEGLRAGGLTITILCSETCPGKFAEEFGVRKCRVRFDQLVDTQVTQLENIILNSMLP